MITHTVHSDRKSLVCIIACTKKSACNITRNLLCLHSKWSWKSDKICIRGDYLYAYGIDFNKSKNGLQKLLNKYKD